MSIVCRIFAGLLIICSYHEAARTNTDSPKCLRNQFKCANGKECVSKYSRCDSTKDCDDWSDEHGCDSRQCPYLTIEEGYHRCGGGKCIPGIWVCDGMPDCYDHSDEKNCSDCTQPVSKSCLSNEFQCSDGKSCIPKFNRCDGRSDCRSDGSDESGCIAHECLRGYHRCGTGRCVPDMFVCDGVRDCDDESDEKDCAIVEDVCTLESDEVAAACSVPIHPYFKKRVVGITSFISGGVPVLGHESKVTGWYPSNVRELEEYCTKINTYVPCFINWKLKCHPNARSPFALGSALDACAKGSAFHKGVQENIGCLSKSWKNQLGSKTHCAHIGRIIIEKSMKSRDTTDMADLLPDEKTTQIIYTIIERFRVFGCFLSHLECPTAEDALLESLVRTFSYDSKTTHQFKNITFEVLDRLSMEDEQKMWVKDGVEKFEKKCEEINCHEYGNKLWDLYYSLATSF